LKFLHHDKISLKLCDKTTFNSAFVVDQVIIKIEEELALEYFFKL